jgi:peptide/nickel transport system substrate-binding protein
MGTGDQALRKTLLNLLCFLSLALGLATPARAQDRVVIAGGADVVGLNGIDVIVLSPDRFLMDHIGDTLLRWEKPGQLGPGLATTWKNIDPLTWELTLRRGVKFHDGEPFDASVVKFSYDTMLDPAVKSPSKTNHTFVQRVEVVDDFTVRIVTREPFPITPNQLTFLHMLPPKYLAQVGIDGYRRKPIGTGPYRFVEHVPDTRVVLERVDGHWLGPQPIKTIVYRPIKEDATRVSALLAGEIDLALDLPPELIQTVTASRRAKIKTVSSTRVFIMGMSNLDPALPTAKVPVREAINFAIDRDSLSKTLFNGTSPPAAWMNPDTFGANPALKPIARDPQRARRLLAEAGYPNGFDVTLDAPDGRYLKDRELAEAMAGQLSQVGIRTTVKLYEWGLHTRRIFSHRTSPLFLFGWADSKGDPESHNRFVLKTDGSWSQFTDPKLDAMIAAIDTEMDRDRRKQLIYDLQDYQRQQFPVAYVLQMGSIHGTSSKLDWWEPRSDEKVWLFRSAQ